MADRATLLREPPLDESKSPLESALEVTELAVLGPDLYTNTRPAWHPPGARGIYGGSVIALCLTAGYRTVPADFTVHSYHCYFILAGNPDVPLLLHVERVRDGRSFATRTVQARQKGRAVFTATMSFVRLGSGGERQVRHALEMPGELAVVGGAPPDAKEGEGGGGGGGKREDAIEARFGGGSDDNPMESRRIEVVNKDGAPVHKKTRQWVRAKGRISAAGGPAAHAAALAYMSDSSFIGTIGRIHRLWQYSHLSPRDVPALPRDAHDYLAALNDFEGMGADLGPRAWAGRPEVGIMVSLDHAIYFHVPLGVPDDRDSKTYRADDWMLSEMDSPWAADGRGVVAQRIFAKDGTLLATCVQEGLVRLKQDDEGKKSKL